MKKSELRKIVKEEVHALVELFWDDFVKKTFKNPDTGREISIETALTYDQNTKAYKIAKKMYDAKKESEHKKYLKRISATNTGIRSRWK